MAVGLISLGRDGEDSGEGRQEQRRLPGFSMATSGCWVWTLPALGCFVSLSSDIHSPWHALYFDLFLHHFMRLDS